MESIFQDLLILMVVVWSVAILLRKIGLPTIMGELVMGVVLGLAVLGWVHHSEIIELLAQMGIFFLLLHTGVKTEPWFRFRSASGLACCSAYRSSPPSSSA
jgi:Kef-type K+ transport system membrane component KefB